MLSYMLTATEVTVCTKQLWSVRVLVHTEVSSYVCCDMQQLILDR